MLKASLSPSHILAAILILAHGAAITVVALVGMQQWLQLIVIAALLANLAYVVMRVALLRALNSAVALEVTSDNALSIQTRSGEWIECEVLGSTYVVSFLTVLNLRELEKVAVRHIMILPDSMDAEDFRRLRVWLRWKHGTPQG